MKSWTKKQAPPMFNQLLENKENTWHNCCEHFSNTLTTLKSDAVIKAPELILPTKRKSCLAYIAGKLKQCPYNQKIEKTEWLPGESLYIDHQMMEILSLRGTRYKFDVYNEGSEKIFGLSLNDWKFAGNQLAQLLKSWNDKLGTE